MKEQCFRALCHDGGFGRRACGTGPGRLAGGWRRFRGGLNIFAVLGGGRGSRLTCTTSRCRSGGRRGRMRTVSRGCNGLGIPGSLFT